MHLLEHRYGFVTMPKRGHHPGELLKRNRAVALDVEPVEGLP